MNEYIKKSEESITSYWIRLYKNRQAYGLTFAECGALMNEVSGTDWNEAKWRREMEGFLKVSEYLQKENPTGITSNELQEIQDEKLELQKEKLKFRDQKREFNNRLRRMARLENLEDYLKEVTEELEPVSLPVEEQQESNGSEAMVVLSDWHLGAEHNGRFNKFNSDVARYRINKVKQKTFDKIKKEEIQTLHIANLGDMVHGIIHVSTKIQSEEDVIQQVITASEYLKDFIGTFLQEGIYVKYYNVIGNHGRVTPSKNEVAGIEENFEKLILTILDTAFGKFLNYESIGCQDGLIETEIVGKKFILTHGNFDKNTNAAHRLPQLLGYVPDYIISGHIHHDTSKDFGRTMHIVNPSLIGADDYATSGRFGGRAGQKIITFDENDIESITNIYLS